MITASVMKELTTLLFHEQSAMPLREALTSTLTIPAIAPAINVDTKVGCGDSDLIDS